jgi:hypothetical protein
LTPSPARGISSCENLFIAREIPHHAGRFARQREPQFNQTKRFVRSFTRPAFKGGAS